MEQLLEKANTGTDSEISVSDGCRWGDYLSPETELIYAGLYEENNMETANWDDGSHKEYFHGEKRLVTVKTVSYTGWKIVSVMPMECAECRNV